jgi:mono/diheme cytochrome c family protein
MTGLIRWLGAAFVVAVGSAITSAADSGDLAIKARLILKKHCAECHSGAAGAPSTLAMLDYAQLTDKDRRLPAFVKSSAASNSQIIQFMEEGSMPPGDRPRVPAEDIAVVRAWIEGGATAYPKKFDDVFAYAAILKDLQSAPADFKSFRYFTLHHLLTDDGVPLDLGALRESFRKALNSVVRKELVALKTIDPTGTIIRVSLTDLGWDNHAFERIQDGKPPLEVDFTLFDVMLLEYPHGEMPPATKEAEQLTQLWLRPSAPVRPVTFVRADWFATAVDGTPLKTDLKRLLELNGGRKRGIDAPEKKSPPLKLEDLANLPALGQGKAVPIVAIDAWYAADYQPKNGPKIDMISTDPEGKPKTKFKSGERVKLEIRSDSDVFIDLMLIDTEGTISQQTPINNNRIRGGVAKEVRIGGAKDGLFLGDGHGKYRFVLFAAADTFPEGERLSSKHESLAIERYVHRFYPLPAKIGDPPRFDPAKMARTTAVIEVTK